MSTVETCPKCFRPGIYGKSGGSGHGRCLRHFLASPSLIRRALAATVVVGTILTLINQGDALAHGELDRTMLLKIPLTYCVPFFVTIWGAMSRSWILSRPCSDVADLQSALTKTRPDPTQLCMFGSSSFLVSPPVGPP